MADSGPAFLPRFWSYLAVCADPSSDEAGQTGSCLVPERISPGSILAGWAALVDVGHHRDDPAGRRYLCHDRKTLRDHKKRGPRHAWTLTGLKLPGNVLDAERDEPILPAGGVGVAG